jgi:hypothetical protein
VVVNRAPVNEYELRSRFTTDMECTAIYTVNLEAQFTTQGNDLGMLAAHGADTRIPNEDPRLQNFGGIGGLKPNIGTDWRGHPFPTDSVKQAAARAQQSVTALTEVTTATPWGFQRDMLHMYHAVCVNVRGVQGRWVEIMAESLQPDQQICVQDWKRPNLAENPLQSACGNGNLYVCRESANEITSSGTYKDEMAVKFFCQDSCDDPYFEFYWRITASQLKPVEGVQPDGENWCGMRAGDDFPSSLLDPYPENYDEPPVFGRSRSSASTAVSSLLVAALVAVLRYFA